MEILAALAGIVIVIVIVKFLALSTKVLWKLLVNSITGLLFLFVLNFVGGLFGLQVPVNILNALVVGVFGIPGFIVLLLLSQ
ncbi:MAG: pro-sigmaK processing inhibitor BofA family protein [Tissierellia bacterium]|nr:pro-sigmaK processing inhibitor BofA family protein [Tissierellia bacterium]